MYFSIMKYSADNNASLDIINLDTLVPKHGESTKVYTRCYSLCHHCLLFHFLLHHLVIPLCP